MELLAADFVVDHGDQVVMLLEEEVVFNLCDLSTNMAILLPQQLRQSLTTLALEPHWVDIVLVQRVEEVLVALRLIFRSLGSLNLNYIFLSYF